MATHNSRAVWHIYIYIYIYTYVHTFMLSYIHVIIHINAYIACMHTYIDIHTYIHTYILSLSLTLQGGLAMRRRAVMDRRLMDTYHLYGTPHFQI